MSTLSTEECHDMEPHLQPLSCESQCLPVLLQLKTMQDWKSQLVVFGVEGLVCTWSFFDIKVFNPYAYRPSIPGFPGLYWVSMSPPSILELSWVSAFPTILLIPGLQGAKFEFCTLCNVNIAIGG